MKKKTLSQVQQIKKQHLLSSTDYYRNEDSKNKKWMTFMPKLSFMFICLINCSSILAEKGYVPDWIKGTMAGACLLSLLIGTLMYIFRPLTPAEMESFR